MVQLNNSVLLRTKGIVFTHSLLVYYLFSSSPILNSFASYSSTFFSFSSALVSFILSFSPLSDFHPLLSPSSFLFSFIFSSFSSFPLVPFVFIFFCSSFPSHRPTPLPSSSSVSSFHCSSILPSLLCLSLMCLHAQVCIQVVYVAVRISSQFEVTHVLLQGKDEIS